jgi:hypothetical protein
VKKQISLVALLILLFFQVAPAFAQGTVIVEDNTGDLKVSQVEQAANKLANKGATVVLVVAEEVGSDPRLYFRSVLEKHRIRTDPLDPSVIGIVIAYDRRNTYMYYGANWTSALQNNYTTIINDHINPQMAKGDPTEGLIQGLNNTVSVIDNPRSVGGGDDGFLAWCFGIPVIGGLAYWIASSVRKRNETKRVLKAAIENRDQARRHAGVAIADLSQALAASREKAQFDKISYADSDVRQLSEWQKTAEKAFIAIQERFDHIDDALLQKSEPTPDDYNAIAEEYIQLATEVPPAREVLSKAEERRLELDKLNAQAPGDVGSAKKALADVVENFGGLSEEGARADVISEQARNLVEQAEALLNERRAGDAINVAQAASAILTAILAVYARYNDIREGISTGRAAAQKVVSQGYQIERGMQAFQLAEDRTREALKALEQSPESALEQLDLAEKARVEGVARGGGMPALHKTNDERIAKLDQEGKQLSDYLAEGRRTFDIVDEFAESTWQDIRGNGSEAEAAASRALKAWQQAKTRNTMETQDFYGAQQDLDYTEQQMAEARNLIDIIIQRLKDLEAARASARSEIEMAQKDIDAGWAFIRANDPDIGLVPEDYLQRAGSLLDEANAEIAKERPDWLMIVKQALQANQLADQALADARSEVETMNKVRNEVKDAQQHAAAEVQKVVQYVSLHKDELPDSAHELVSGLQTKVQNAYKSLQSAERLEDSQRLTTLRKATEQYLALREQSDKVFVQVQEQYEKVKKLQQKANTEVLQAQTAISRASRMLSQYSSFLESRTRRTADKLIRQAEQLSNQYPSIRDEQSMNAVIAQARDAHKLATRAEQTMRDEIQVLQNRRGSGGGDFFDGVLIGSILNDHHHHGSSSSGGWGGGSSSSGDSGGGWSGWGGGGGGGWDGGGGGGGGWDGGGGGDGW